ncbi:MAG: hypothetical protein HOM25_13250 [Rhodospirillaceae bacterium]|jgi:hypothetical protein|nr:hypothetical protein [Rhodospirillaceae bacterium]MBT5665794.1 hypothetical protein [Rhodospirillaceae bacterium]MBT5809117.1 hypothetical protein [Rhodospirillaceae bacterium]
MQTRVALFFSVANARLVFAVVIAMAAFGVLVGNAQAAGGTPAALALDVDGATTPPIEPFTELGRGQKVQLEPGTMMEFMHYATCQSVTIKGGRLSFSGQRYFLKGGKIVKTQRAECPKSVALKGASQIGGVVLRSSKGASTLRVSSKPSFVLIGEQAAHYKSIRVNQGDKTLLEGEIHGRVFHWPDGAPALEKGKSYAVTLVSGSDDKPRVFILKPKGSNKKGAMALIRVD